MTRTPAPAWLRLLTLISGVLGFLLFVATPFLPVQQTQSTLNWPQDDDLGSVVAPLVSYAPQEIHATIPMSALDDVREGQDLVFGTLPEHSEQATSRGLFVRSFDGSVDVVSEESVVLQLTPEQVKELPKDAVLSIESTVDATSAEIRSASSGAEIHSESVDRDVRPQVSGIFTELEGDATTSQQLRDAGISATVQINSRFTSSPTLLKGLAMGLGIVLMLVSLWGLHRLDRLDGKPYRGIPATWKRFRPLDGVVVFVLAWWHIFGANTSDDGFLLTMARASHHSGYMANYYRWYGVPESPFGSPYYDLLALFSQVSTSSLWMRMPALIFALAMWFIVSRELIPRMGPKVDGRRLVHWSAAGLFLAFWLPYDNGTRPEPFIAVMIVLTWASFERAVATNRLLPAAVGTLFAAVTLSGGPTGLFGPAILFVFLPALITILRRRLPLLGDIPTWQGVLVFIAPFLASGTAILVAVFGDQPLGSVLESIRVRAEVGPSLRWHDEGLRYTTLFEQLVDGSMTRRLPVFLMVAAAALITVWLIRHRGRVPGVAQGPIQRGIVIFFIGTALLSFTPTKWTHHFGIYPGLAAVLGGVAAVVLGRIVMKAVWARTLTLGTFLFIFAQALGGPNGWWYVAHFSVPWWDKTIQYKGVEAADIVLAISLIIIVVGVIQLFLERHRIEEGGTPRPVRPSRYARACAAPIAVLGCVIVLFSMATFTKAFIGQYPGYSIGLGNLRTFEGKQCGMASDVLVEDNTNDSFLTPADGRSLKDSLSTQGSYGFHPNGVAEDISADDADTTSVGSIGKNSDSSTANENANAEDTDATSSTTGGFRAHEGINGSRATLPFNLDYTTVPVLGSYTPEDQAQRPAKLTTSWYSLPSEQKEDSPLLVVSLAGRTKHHDINGVKQGGQKFELQYGTREADGSVHDTGSLEMLDAGPIPSWRNVRLPLERIPEGANVVRLYVEDTSMDPDQWVAVTPPRVPHLVDLNTFLGSEKAGLLDWSVGLQFPCQRSYDHYAGVAEIPDYRISPDYDGKVWLSDFQDYNGGGAMGSVESVLTSWEKPAYLKDDWQQDWGSLEMYSLRKDSRGETPQLANIDYETITRNGWWNPGEMKLNAPDYSLAAR
ncbi:arabinosyltransferase domain-containing protein [Corynebacterium uropygiale]|uniref:Arabinosyltransferase domain-containing protein n=1 Tax=Corynebacterium uropygiale TaxID=1775911 RepID=A0A9X1TZQ7_9CORY|nr:arabinosyltransferase domain-containing protein [Corynebacterium uropygiale]